MRRKGYTLIEVLGVISIIAIVLVIAVPNINRILNRQKKNTMLIDAKSIMRQVQYENKQFSTATLASLNLDGINLDNYDQQESFVYIRKNVLSINLVGINKFEGMYLCDVNESTKSVENSVSTPCDEMHDPALILELNGGQVTGELEPFYPENTVVNLPTPLKEGYAFTGWEVIDGDGVINNNKITIGSEDTTIYALYAKTINLIVDLDGGTTTQSIQPTYISGEDIQLRNPFKAGKLFIGWEEISGNSILSGSTLTIGSEDSEIKALYTDCSAGTYNDGTASACTICSAGTYSAAGASACAICSAGTHSGEGSSSCTACTAGTYSDAGAGSCTSCIAGTYSGTGSSSCTSCAAGTYSSAGAGSCTSCIAGTYSTEGQPLCTSCAAGTYSGTGSSSCISCTAGTYSEAGSSSCTSCPAGTYSDAGAGSCTSCLGGTYSAAGATSCTECESGTFSGNGSTSCTSCPEGTFSGTGSSSCTSCPGGMSGGGTDITSCSMVCGAGTYLKAGETSCRNCPAGKYCLGGTFSYDASNDQGISGDCNANTYSVGGATAATCTPCPGSMTSTAGATAVSQCKISCAAGTYLKAGETSCRSCPGGKYCTGAVYGYNASNDQGITGNCNAGRYSTGGASAATCTACAKGSYSAAGASSCTACQPSGAAGANGTTSGTGATSCNASCGKSNVNTWKTASWSANSVSNSCTINTCKSGYKLSSNTCVQNTCYACCQSLYTNDAVGSCQTWYYGAYGWWENGVYHCCHYSTTNSGSCSTTSASNCS